MQPMFDLTGKVAVVTGSTRGMGLAMAQALGQAGASLVVSGRSAASAEAAALGLRAQGFAAQGLALDVADPARVERFAAEALAAFGRVDVLVLNAAGAAPTGSLLAQSPALFDEVMASNLRPNFVLVNALAPQMVARRDGSIVFMSSRAAKRGTALLGLYGMSKAATDQYVRCLAIELGPHNINVNSLCPGPVRTDFSRGLWEKPEREAGVVAATPLRRIGEPEDVAGITVLLASPAGRFIHGQNISVDGGMTA
ncbi:MAG: SDR family oxidoreductase [Pseudomonadota bacterium]